MPEATLTTKGQITIPKEVRDDLGIQPGSKVTFVKMKPGDVRIIAKTGDIRDLIGILHNPDRAPMTIEEMNDAIADAAADSAAAGLDWTHAKSNGRE